LPFLHFAWGFKDFCLLPFAFFALRLEVFKTFAFCLLPFAFLRFACGLPQIRRFLILGFSALLGFLPLSH
jgi:hypothetical protein